MAFYQILPHLIVSQLHSLPKRPHLLKKGELVAYHMATENKSCKHNISLVNLHIPVDNLGAGGTYPC